MHMGVSIKNTLDRRATEYMLGKCIGIEAHRIGLATIHSMPSRLVCFLNKLVHSRHQHTERCSWTCFRGDAPCPACGLSSSTVDVQWLNAYLGECAKDYHKYRFIERGDTTLTHEQFNDEFIAHIMDDHSSVERGCAAGGVKCEDCAIIFCGDALHYYYDIPCDCTSPLTT